MQELRLGFNFYDPNRRDGYPPGTLFVEPIYTHPRVGPPLNHWNEVASRVEGLKYQGHRLLLRIHFTEDQDHPHDGDLGGKSEYLRSIEIIARMLPFHNSIITFGNEPNLPGPQYVPNKWWAEICNGYGKLDSDPFNAMQIWRTYDNTAQFYVTAFAPYSPNDGDTTLYMGEAERSPWARSFMTFLDYSASDNWARQYDGYVLHAYGRVGTGDVNEGAFEPWVDVRSEQGWRFGTNVLETWREVISNHMDFQVDQPAIVGEFNTSADGPHRSNVSYRQGALQNALLYTARAYPEVTDFCWFVDRDPGGWEGESLSKQSGQMVFAEEDTKEIMEWQRR